MISFIRRHEPLRWGSVDVSLISPPDSLESPHSWAVRTFVLEGRVHCEYRCPRCGGCATASFREGSHRDLASFSHFVRNLPVPASCDLALAQHVMEA